MQLIILVNKTSSNHLRLRTRRAAIALGIPNQLIYYVDEDHNPQQLCEWIDETLPVWIIREGAWPRVTSVAFPPPSQTGRGVIAFGVHHPPPWTHSLAPRFDPAFTKWNNELGGYFDKLKSQHDLLRITTSCWLDAIATSVFRDSLNTNRSVAEAYDATTSSHQTRLVRWEPLDVYYDESLRVAQILTSLQRGGAERIAIELHEAWLNDPSMASILVALGKPTRAAFAAPRQTVELGERGSRQQRMTHCRDLLSQFHCDLIHCHLLNQREHDEVAKIGSPVITTIHNARHGWPEGIKDLSTQQVQLAIACSKAVEEDLRDARLSIPTRTVWNGVHTKTIRASSARKSEARKAIRERLRLPESAVLVLSLANPRPQKRLEKLPSIIRVAERMFRNAGRDHRLDLLVAGEPSHVDPAAAHSMQLLHDSIALNDLGNQTHFLGSVTNVEEVLHGIDVVISTSRYEGLSLAHLEALAAGVPVIATDVGGTQEIGDENVGLHLLSAEATDEQFAQSLVDVILSSKKANPDQIALHFDFERMRDGYLRFYKRCASAMPLDQGGLLLIINNFSTGGAQSSARRLMKALQADGVRVRAAVLQENPLYPTPGLEAVIADKIPVTILTPAGQVDPQVAIEPLLQELDRDPPQVILFWNVIAEYKVLIADQTISSDLFDISPGEMNFQSFARYLTRPRPGLPYRTMADYGKRLKGAVVKFAGEKSVAETLLKTSVHVIPNGVPLPEVQAQHACKETVVFGTSVRISPQKRLDLLLESFRHVKDQGARIELQVAGGVESGSEDYARKLFHDYEQLSVRWLGEQRDVDAFLRTLDGFVMISEPAGCPNASLEAMAMGLPIVATDYGGASEQVVNGVNGFLVGREDCEAFAAAMVRLAKDWKLRRDFGAASRAIVEERFSLSRMLSDYRSVLATCPLAGGSDAIAAGEGLT